MRAAWTLTRVTWELSFGPTPLLVLAKVVNIFWQVLYTWILRSFIKNLQYMLSAKEGMPKRIKLGMLCEFIAYKDRLKTMLQVALFLQVSWGKSRNKFTKPGASNLANLCTSWQEKMQDVDQHYNSIKEMMKITFVYRDSHFNASYFFKQQATTDSYQARSPIAFLLRGAVKCNEREAIKKLGEYSE